MLNQIPQQHQVAMATAVKSHVMDSDKRVTPTLLNRLYALADAGFRETVFDDTAVTSVLRGDLGELSTATDKATGTYVQLTRVKGNPRTTLTVGKKWVSESANALGAANTTFW